MDLATLDAIRLNFSPESLAGLNAAIALIMFGVALDLHVEDFTALLRDPRAPAIGLCLQFFAFPLLAFLMAWSLAPTPSMALGMILVAACPGGNISNFFTRFGGGRTSVSVGMTAVSTLATMVMLPFNVSFYGGMMPETAALLQAFELDAVGMSIQVLTLLGIPITLGMATAHWLPSVAERLKPPMTWLSVVFFCAVVGLAFHANFEIFLAIIGMTFVPVAALNLVGMGMGYMTARLARLEEPDRRAIALEVGIQNSALGLVLVFDFFDGLGGMAVLLGWWGSWHILSALFTSSVWRWQDHRREAA